jgi:aspartate aminotransferase
LLSEAGVRVYPPTGGFYLFLDFSPFAERLAKRGITDSAALCDRLLKETGVAILPGVSFDRPVEELTARMAYVDFDGAKALTSSETIPLEEPLPDNFCDSWCLNVVAGINSMIDWLKK